jgi:hypothetical protein
MSLSQESKDKLQLLLQLKLRDKLQLQKPKLQLQKLKLQLQRPKLQLRDKRLQEVALASGIALAAFVVAFVVKLSIVTATSKS